MATHETTSAQEATAWSLLVRTPQARFGGLFHALHTACDAPPPRPSG
jgi:hypothetical protein